MGVRLCFRGHMNNYDSSDVHEFIQEPNVCQNPDPENFELLGMLEIACGCGKQFATIVEALYPNCTNYDGRKLLVFPGVHSEDIKATKVLDPHFFKGSKWSPLARFEPTQHGADLAIAFVDNVLLTHTQKDCDEAWRGRRVWVKRGSVLFDHIIPKVWK